MDCPHEIINFWSYDRRRRNMLVVRQ